MELLGLLVLAGCAGEEPVAPRPPASRGDAGTRDAAGEGEGEGEGEGADASRGRDSGPSDAGLPVNPGDAAAPDAGSAPPTFASCFGPQFVGPLDPLADYDSLMPTLGSHCRGTNLQDIEGVERVVFLGDSVTVGTPPTVTNDYYRSRLADTLAGVFSLDAPGFTWKSANPGDGEAGVREDGAFASCSRWGTQTGDLLGQLEACFPDDRRSVRTLVVITMGGNDLSSLVDAAAEGASEADLEATTREFVEQMRQALLWLKAPDRFPAGVFVIFANVYEFTDGTGDVRSCPASQLAGIGELPDPAVVRRLLNLANLDYLRMAIETNTDMIFLYEAFCGRGYKRDDPMGPCYRGPNQENWFDLTCIHPTSVGHEAIADMFFSVVQE